MGGLQCRQLEIKKPPLPVLNRSQLYMYTSSGTTAAEFDLLADGGWV